MFDKELEEEMKLELKIKVHIPDWFINPIDPDELSWLYNEILVADTLTLHSNEIGDEVGEITEVEILDKN